MVTYSPYGTPNIDCYWGGSTQHKHYREEQLFSKLRTAELKRGTPVVVAGTVTQADMLKVYLDPKVGKMIAQNP